MIISLIPYKNIITIIETKLSYRYSKVKKLMLCVKSRINGTFDDFNFQLNLQLQGKQLIDCFRLRAKIFCQELHWVGTDNTILEVDEFDVFSSHIGVVNSKNRIVGTLRITTYQHPWFMEKYFSNLLPADFDQLKLNSSIEVSRMAIDDKVRAKLTSDGKGIADLLHKGLFHYCQTHKISYVYTIVSTRMYKFLRIHRMPMHKIGPIIKMPDGVEAVATVLVWKNLYRSENLRDKSILKWLKRPSMEFKNFFVD